MFCYLVDKSGLLSIRFEIFSSSEGWLTWCKFVQFVDYKVDYKVMLSISVKSIACLVLDSVLDRDEGGYKLLY